MNRRGFFGAVAGFIGLALGRKSEPDRRKPVFLRAAELDHWPTKAVSENCHVPIALRWDKKSCANRAEFVAWLERES